MILKNNHLTQFEMQSLEKGKTTFRKQKKKNGKILVIVMYAKQDQLFYEQKKKKGQCWNGQKKDITVFRFDIF